MASKLLATLIEGNAKFAQTYTSPPPLMKMREVWKKEGIKGATILSCSDPRVVPENFLPGAYAVVRNAGGRSMDAMRSLLVLNAINPTGLVVVVHHTDCGTTHVHDAEVRESIRKAEASLDTLNDMKFGEIIDLEKSIREDVEAIRTEPLFGKQRPEVVGLLYDIDTGLVREIEGLQETAASL